MDSPAGRRFWKLWPWIAWVLPPALLLVRWFAPYAGWGTLMALFFSWLWIPAAAVLVLLPRFMLRKRGHSSSPTIVSLLMVTFWVSVVIAVLALRDFGDLGSDFSPLATAFNLSEDSEASVSLVAIPLAVLAYLAALVCARVLHPGESPSRGAAFVWAPLIVVPLVVWLIAGIHVHAGRFGDRDAAGNHQRDVGQLSADEARTLQEERWDATQEELVPLRKAISVDGWQVGELNRVVADDRGGSSAPEYSVNVEWEHRTEDTIHEVAATFSQLDELQEWEVEEPYFYRSGKRVSEEHEDPSAVMFEAQNSGGYGLRMDVGWSPDEGAQEQNLEDFNLVQLQMVSPKFWLEGKDVDWYALKEFGKGVDLRGSAPTLFRYDDWPELSLTQTR